MPQYTNLSWPDDPYGTGQQLYRRSKDLLAGFSVLWADDGAQALPVACAVAYLRLHRTHAVSLDPAEIDFGFRAVAVSGSRDIEDLAVVFDLDLLQARRHAVIMAGYSLTDDLYCMDRAVSLTMRGVQAVKDDWPRRDRSQRGKARMVDTAGYRAATVENLHQHCDRFDIAPDSAPGGLAMPSEVAKRCAALGDPDATQWLARAAVEKALVISLIAGRLEYRCTWSGRVDVSASLAAQAWPEFAPAQEAAL